MAVKIGDAMLIEQAPQCVQITTLNQREHRRPEAGIKDGSVVCRAEVRFSAKRGSQCDSVAERAAREGLQPCDMRLEVALLFCTRQALPEADRSHMKRMQAVVWAEKLVHSNRIVGVMKQQQNNFVIHGSLSLHPNQPDAHDCISGWSDVER